MYTKKECVAMLLAGGRGSRLYKLTDKIAKPAVPFGGKYRIIDFTLSNCINSGIDTVGVLTQYQPMVLNEYIGTGEPWDLDRSVGGARVLPPYQGTTSDWYKGTANAIYQNLNFIARYDPEYVLILSGDHIYKMDYSKMLDYHKERNADCTIAVIDVPIEQASRFGIMNTYDDGRIYEFEEKPPNPKSTHASMGIYIFNKDKLFKYLTEDEEDPESSKDFGKNVIPKMLNNGETMFAYPFSGYWKDVGTLESLWEANMDLLGDNPEFYLNDRRWRIYFRNYALPPHYIGCEAEVKNSIITEGCNIHGCVINSVLSNGVVVEPGAVVKDSIIMANTCIKKGAEINYSIIDTEVVVGENCRIGAPRADNVKITLVGSELEIDPGVTIEPGSMINAADLASLKNKNN